MSTLKQDLSCVRECTDCLIYNQRLMKEPGGSVRLLETKHPTGDTEQCVVGSNRRCHEKTSYVSNFVLSFYCMNGSIEGRCTNYKNSSVGNFDFIARSVLLEFFKVMCLPSIDPFMQ